tara:strand:- start:1004 stop:1627 length:624 start_codon:yes stop_codon:yes gene_type:complete
MEGNLGRVGFIGRFKPLHNGASVLLESLCENAEHVTIGIGSVNKYNLRNPFTAEETEGMIEAFLEDRFSNYSIVKIPDSGHIPEFKDGRKWKQDILENFGELDHFVSGNDYVRSLLKDQYDLIVPWEVVPRDKWTRLRATRVRYEMACETDWRKLVPDSVAKYIVDNGIDFRFRDEFGLQTIAMVNFGNNYNDKESAAEEKKHTLEV